MLHGIGSRAEVWEPVAAELARSREVVAIDLPGFGRSPARAERPTIEALADQVVELCDSLGLDRPHVAGNSLGGAVALELGRRGAARSVTAFSPIGFWHTPGILWARTVLRVMRAATPRLRLVLPALLTIPGGRIALFSLFYARPRRIPRATLLADADSFAAAEGFDATLNAMSRHVFEGHRGGLDAVPVTIAWGSTDRILPRRTQASRARRALPHALHVNLVGCGHVPFFDDPLACLMVLRREWRAPGASRAPHLHHPAVAAAASSTTTN